MKKISKLTVVFLIMVMALTACGKSVEEQIAEQLELGNRYLEELDYEQAIVAFNKVIELEPNEVRAYTGLLTAYLGSEQMENAGQIVDDGIAGFTKDGIDYSEENIQIFLETAGDYYVQLEDPEALYDYWKLMNSLYAGNEQYQESLEESRSAYVDYLLEKADESLEQENMEEALKYLKNAVELNENENIDIRIKAIENGGEYEKIEDGVGYIYNAWGLNVRTNHYDENGELISYVIHIFDEEKRWSECYYYYADDELYEYDIHTFDETGEHWSRIDYYDADGTLLSSSESVYDENGNCVRQNSYDSKGMLNGYWENTFDEFGNRITETRYDENGEMRYSYRSTYDAARNRIREEEYDESGELQRYWEYTYDAEGQQTGETEYNADGTLQE